MEAGTTLQQGDKIRLNMQGAMTETVAEQRGNSVFTYEGHIYHITKIVLADAPQKAIGEL